MWFGTMIRQTGMSRPAQMGKLAPNLPGIRRKGEDKPEHVQKKKAHRKKKRGKLVLDATVVPTDIKYPTDIDLLNRSRKHLETVVDIFWHRVTHTSHKLPYSTKKPGSPI